jgi:lactate dehydrogenase-like 2-hydroxyacid dehydrogenase
MSWAAVGRALKKLLGGADMRISFWVIEGKKRKKGEITWWFEQDVCSVDELIERLDLVSRTALSFWSEEPLDPEARSLLNRIVPSLSPRAQALVKDLLV